MIEMFCIMFSIIINLALLVLASIFQILIDIFSKCLIAKSRESLVFFMYPDTISGVCSDPDTAEKSCCVSILILMALLVLYCFSLTSFSLASKSISVKIKINLHYEIYAKLIHLCKKHSSHPLTPTCRRFPAFLSKSVIKPS